MASSAHAGPSRQQQHQQSPGGGSDGDDGFSWLTFHRTLTRAGLTEERAAFQSAIGHLVEDVASAIVESGSGDSYYDWMMTGSFVEGWGNHLFRLDGVTGADSDIDWSQVVKHKVYHLKDSCHSVVDCINRKDYVLVDGHINVKNCSTQPAFDTERHGLRPDADECQAYPCCSYPTIVLNGGGVEVSSEMFRQLLLRQFDNAEPVEDVHFVRASVPGQTNQMRLSCTRQERHIMSQLTTVQGQLFTVLKYLFKTEASEAVDGQRAGKGKKRKLIENLKSFHAKTLLMTLLRDEDSWPAPGQSEEAQARQLERLLHKAFTVLNESIDRSVASDGTSRDREAPRMPRVLDHALLHDSGLYLKVSKDAAAENRKRERPLSDEGLHAEKLAEVKSEIRELTGEQEKLPVVLMEYLERIERTLTVRGIPTVRANLSYSGREPRFLFVPLAMLPRITMDTLLEERERWLSVSGTPSVVQQLQQQQLQQPEQQEEQHRQQERQHQQQQPEQQEEQHRQQERQHQQQEPEQQEEQHQQQPEQQEEQQQQQEQQHQQQERQHQQQEQQQQQPERQHQQQERQHQQQEPEQQEQQHQQQQPEQQEQHQQQQPEQQEQQQQQQPEQQEQQQQQQPEQQEQQQQQQQPEQQEEQHQQQQQRPEQQQKYANAIDVLKDAYINVWIILKSLSSNSKPPETADAERELEDAWQWVASRRCLKSTHACLKVMKHLKAGDKSKEEIRRLLTTEAPDAPARWINLPEKRAPTRQHFDELVSTEDCLWAFHYFTRPKEKMDYSYLKQVQDVWKHEASVKYRMEKDRACEYVQHVRKSWLTHLHFHEDRARSKQPSLTVNFDGLRDSLRRCYLGAGAVEDDDFFSHINQCLFDPRPKAEAK